MHSLNERPGRHNRLSPNESGWIAEGLLAALFTGLALCIILLSWYPTTALFMRWSNAGYVGIATVVILVMPLTYWAVACYRKHRFIRGGRDHLFIRSLMKTSLNRDCSAIEHLLSDPDTPAIISFNTLLLSKLQSILDSEDARIGDLQTHFRDSGLKRIQSPQLAQLFHHSSEYDQIHTPHELEVLYSALSSYDGSMGIHLSQLADCRRNLFTVMSNYLEIFSVAYKDVAQLKQTYRFHPPETSLAQVMIFAKRAIDYLKAFNLEKLPSQKRDLMESVALLRIEELRSAMARYRCAWIDLVNAYDAMPLNRQPSKKRNLSQ